MTPEITEQSEALFDEAERVADRPEVLARVKHARLSLEYVTVMRRVKSAMASEDAQERAATPAALKDFAARCAADGMAQWKEGEALEVTVARLAAGLAAKG